MCPVMNSLSLLCATNSSLFPLLRRQNCRGHCRGYDYSPSTGWNAPQNGFRRKNLVTLNYFFCGAAGGCSLVGGTMFLSRMYVTKLP